MLANLAAAGGGDSGVRRQRNSSASAAGGSLVAVNRLLRVPRWGQLAAAVCTLLALVPVLARLPRVAVTACFDASHPLYTLVPSTAVGMPVTCVTAPEPVVTWTLMVAATLVVHLVLMPVALAAALVLLTGVRRLVAFGGRLLAVALAFVAAIVDVPWLLAPAVAPVFVTAPAHARVNPHRGPPVLS